MRPPNQCKWYIWRSLRTDGDYEWLVQFPWHRKDWWDSKPYGAAISAFNSFEDARRYMLRVESQMRLVS